MHWSLDGLNQNLRFDQENAELDFIFTETLIVRYVVFCYESKKKPPGEPITVSGLTYFKNYKKTI